VVKSGTYSAQALRSNIKDLGSRLGRVLAESHSPEFLKEVELVRRWAKDLRRGSRRSIGNIERFLRLSGSEKSFKIARSFTEFLRLANAAEQHHRTRRRLYYETHSSLPQKGSVEAFLKNLKPKMISQVVEKLNQMEVDLVLTSHPTESMRQSAIRRYKHVTQNLAILDRRDSTRWEKEQAK
jgi:phosphoenolpyruvate carboxylase